MRIIRTITVLLAFAALHTHAQSKPNIVVFLADDFGIGCINAYGAPQKYIRTPHLNKLAKEGMMFTQAYAPGSVCSPTRYALLTGRYAWRGRLKAGVVNSGDPLLIEDGLKTIPKMLKEHGYRTAHIGKWHLGYTRQKKVRNYAALDRIAPGPNEVGFDYHFGVPNNLDDGYRVYFENDKIWGLKSKRVSPYSKCFYGSRYHGYDAPQRRRERVTQDLNDRARKWINETAKAYPNKPLFLYFAAVAVHHPIEPSDKFRGSSPVGAYGDFIHDLDDSVGQVVKTLSDAGKLDNTLFIFSADNGSDSGSPGSPERQAAAAGLKINGILKGDKHTIWEGGVRVPFIVRWPGKVKPGSQSDRLVSILDIYSTLQQIVTGKPISSPKEAVDSFSFADVITGAEPAGPKRQQAVLNNAKGVKALRMGNWKYIEGLAGAPKHLQKQFAWSPEAKPALYQLDKDPSESKNVIKDYPEVLKKMKQRLNAIRQSGSERSLK